MQYITEKQFNDLVKRIYKSLSAVPSFDSDLGDYHEEAENIAREWCEDNEIELNF